jgi:hypothetical protein
MRLIILNSTFLLFALFSFGQQTKIELSKANIKIGEVSTLQLTVEMPASASFLFTPFKVIIPSRIKAVNGTLATEVSNEVEILEDFKDTVLLKGKTKIWKGTYDITAWNEGIFVLSGNTIVIDDSTYEFQTRELLVELEAANKDKDIYDIRESFAEIPDEPFHLDVWLKEYWWTLALIGLIGIYFLYKFLQKRKDYVPVLPKIPSLKERSLMAIDALEKERLWEKDKLKEHYIELSYILRSYLSARYELNLLENTTFSAQQLLKQKGLHFETIKTIGTVLNQSDMVKFAQSEPEELIVLKVSQQVRQIIAETSPLEFDNAE